MIVIVTIVITITQTIKKKASINIIKIVDTMPTKSIVKGDSLMTVCMLGE